MYKSAAIRSTSMKNARIRKASQYRDCAERQRRRKNHHQSSRPNVAPVMDHHLDVPHRGSNLVGLTRILELNTTHRNEWKNLLGLTGLSRSVGVEVVCDDDFVELLTTTRTLRSLSILVTTSTVGSQVSVVNSRI